MLRSLLDEWTAWSRGADRSDEGWESDFPRWRELMAAAAAAMRTAPLDLPALETCWAISEEDEALADVARAHVAEYRGALEALASSRDPRVRWQVYDVLGAAGPGSSTLTRALVVEEDPYCIQRLLLALARGAPQVGAEVAPRFSGHGAAGVRRAALELAAATGDRELVRRVAGALAADRDGSVRARAAELLRET